MNTLYFGGIAQGGIIIACIFTIVGARWPGPVRRIAEGLGAWVPVTFVLSLIGYLGRNHVYPWIGGPPPGKEAWLNIGRLYATDWGIFLLLAVLSVMFLRASLRPALKAAEGEATGFAKRMIASWTAGWRGDEAEREASAQRTRLLAPIICLRLRLRLQHHRLRPGHVAHARPGSRTCSARSSRGAASSRPSR